MKNWQKALISTAVSIAAAYMFSWVLDGFIHGWVSCMAYYVTFEFLEHVETQDEK